MSGGLVLLLVGGMLSFHRASDRRETDLMERLTLLGELVGNSSNWIEQANAKGTVKPDDLPILLRWVGHGYRADWMQKFERELDRRFDRLQDHGERRYRALHGFAVLGTNAAPAIPALVGFLRRGKDWEPAISALGSIGTPVYGTAMKLLKSNSADERMFGAYLLGILQMHPEESVPALLRLKDDKETGVRASVMVALAEFPGAVTTELFGAMLKSEDREIISAGVYGLHAGGPDAMRMLVEKFDSTTNAWVHETILRAVYAREQIWRGPKTGYPRAWNYQMKHGFCFSGSPNLVSIYLRKVDAPGLMNRVRQNLLNGEDTDLAKEITVLSDSGKEEVEKLSE